MKMEMQSGNLHLVFIYSLTLLLIGCAVGMHWRGVAFGGDLPHDIERPVVRPS